MVASDHDGSLDLALLHQPVQRRPESLPLAHSQPADPGGQPLELDPLGGETDPAVERLVLGKRLEHRLVGSRDIARIPGERDPPEGPLPAAEERPDELGHEAGYLERVGDARLHRLRADVVAIVERDRTGILKLAHRAHVESHRGDGPDHVFLRFLGAQADRVLEGDAGRHVPVQLVVRRGLVRDQVRLDPALRQRGQHLGGVSHETDRERRLRAHRVLDPAERVFHRRGRAVQVARRQPPLDPGRVHVDREAYPLVHGDRERLGAAHAAEPGG